MVSSEKILVVIDPTAAEQPALERGAWLASLTDAFLELFVCEHDRRVTHDERVLASLLETDRGRLEQLSARLSKRGFTVAVDVRWHRPLDEGIVRKVVDARPSLVVKDTHYHSAIGRTLFSNTDWNLIRDCPAPLLLVKDRELSAQVRYLAAVDPTRDHDKPADLDRRILDMARRLSRAGGGELHVVHAFEPVPTPTPTALAAAPEAPGIGVAGEETHIAGAEERHEQAFAALVREQSIDEDHAHLVYGDPARALVACTQHLEADFVVMGAVSRSRLKRAFIGHTAERVLDRLPCDLVVVKPEGFEAQPASG